MEEKNFVMTVKNINSPVIITVPHGGMTTSYGSWLENFFNPRVKYEEPDKNCINGEKIVIGGDGPVLHIACDILKKYSANIVAGLLPRKFVDYNRFVPEVAYSDPKIKPFYLAYHNTIKKSIKTLLKYHSKVILIDLHGFKTQPIEGKEFDIILGTNNGESSPNNFDKLLYNFLTPYYNVFCYNVDDLPEESDLYRGDTTNKYYYNKYGIDAILLETSTEFRVGESSKKMGQKLSFDLASFFKYIESST